MEFGVVNPTYDAENLNNEARYPHLSVRAPAPPPAASKLDSCAADRHTSGCYEDPEEERYTTLKNVSDEPTGNDNCSDGKLVVRFLLQVQTEIFHRALTGWTTYVTLTR